MSILVYKIGTRLLTDEAGRLDHGDMERLVNDLAAVWRAGHALVVVSSGAVAAGFPLLGLHNAPKEIVTRQAAASVGQARLMHLYQTLFNPHGIILSQVLLTRGELENRNRFLNAKNAFAELLHRRVLPIVNENDVVAIDEIKLGDNDSLAAITSILVGADRCALLTDVDGILKNRGDPASLVSHVLDVDDAKQYLWAKESKVSTGGMETKLAAARQNADFGIPTIVANGKVPGIISAIAEGKPVGTMIAAAQQKLPAWKHWLLHGARASGALLVDDGAVVALTRQNRSLLPIGITAVQGDFRFGELVEVRHGAQLLAVGIVQYNSSELQQIIGCQSDEIESRLGYSGRDEVINRTDLVLTRGDSR